jgi:ribosomal protein S2
MKRGPQPKRVFNAQQSRARAIKIRALAGILTNARVRAGLERLATKFDQSAAALDTRSGPASGRHRTT